MYVRSLDVTDFRCLARTSQEFHYPGRPGSENVERANVNVLLGGNGAGKSTVMKAIALSLLAPELVARGAVPSHLIRKNSSGIATIRTGIRLPATGRGVAVDATVGIRIRGARPERLTPLPGTQRLDELAPRRPPLLFAYGPNRMLLGVSTGKPSPVYDRVANLLDEWAPLRALDGWLPAIRGRRREEILSLLNRLLPVGATVSGRSAGRRLLFDYQGQSLPLDAMPGGLRALVGWVGDMLFHLHQSTPPPAGLREQDGVVMVDEVALHMHPQWQRSVVQRLAAGLPRMQWFVSTHSPLVAGSVHQNNLFVLAVDPDSSTAGASRVEHYARESIRGHTVDSILTSPFFGMVSSRSLDTERRLKRFARRARAGDRSAAVAFIATLATNRRREDES